MTRKTEACLVQRPLRCGTSRKSIFAALIPKTASFDQLKLVIFLSAPFDVFFMTHSESGNLSMVVLNKQAVKKAIGFVTIQPDRKLEAET